MILYTENPKATRKQLELINQFSKVAGYKINTQKCLAVTMKDQKEKLRKTIPFTIASKRIQYLGISLPEEAKDPYSENYETLLKEMEDDTNKWKEIPRYWIGSINTLNMPILPKVIHRFSAILIKSPMACFTKLEQN